MGLNKKLGEEKILSYFRLWSELPFQVCQLDEATRIFPEYHGENPDFIVQMNTEYIGVEIAQLTADYPKQTSRFKSPFRQAARTGPRTINTLQDLEKAVLDRMEASTDKNTKYLVRQIPVEDALLSTLQNKINKLSKYVTEKIWLLFYADQFHQKGMVSTLKKSDAVWLGNYVYQKIQISDKIQKIFIFETNTGHQPCICPVALLNRLLEIPIVLRGIVKIVNLTMPRTIYQYVNCSGRLVLQA